MKCIIIYFSQTGNTEIMAKAIQEGVNQAARHCDIVPIKDANPRKLWDYDLIGLGCPVFHFVEPDNVKAFIDNMRFVGGKHVFVFNTHGTIPEFFFPSIYPRLKRRGLEIIGMRDWYTNCSLPMMPKPYPTDGHPDDIDLKEAEDFGRYMVERSQKISAGESGLIPPEPPAPPAPPEELLLDDNPNSFSSLVKYHQEKCNYPKCRLCMDNCPMYGIDLTLDPPVIASPCLSCMWCSRICPTGAMDGDGMIDALKEDTSTLMPVLILPKLEKAEKEGRFRMLVPKDKIGYDAPNKIRNKHPQWIIGKGLR